MGLGSKLGLGLGLDSSGFILYCSAAAATSSSVLIVWCRGAGVRGCGGVEEVAQALDAGTGTRRACKGAEKAQRRRREGAERPRRRSGGGGAAAVAAVAARHLVGLDV